MPISMLASNVVQFTLRFQKAGEYADPATVTLRLKRPDGTEVTPAPVPERVEEGVWVATFDTQGQPDGTWWYRAEGDGQLDAAAEGAFTVLASAFGGLGE